MFFPSAKCLCTLEIDQPLYAGTVDVASVPDRLPMVDRFDRYGLSVALNPAAARRTTAYRQAIQPAGGLEWVEWEHSRFPFRHASPPPSQIGERGRHEVVVRCHQAHCNRGPGDRERPVWRRWTGGLAEVIVKRLTEGSIQDSQPAISSPLRLAACRQSEDCRGHPRAVGD